MLRLPSLSRSRSAAFGSLAVLALVSALAACGTDDDGNDGVTPGVDAGSGADARPTLDTGARSCRDEDDLSLNHVAADATAVGSAVFLRDDLFLCPGLQDWFAVQPVAGKELEVRLDGAGTDDLDLWLVAADADSVDDPLLVGEPVDGVVGIDWVADSEAPVFVVVGGAADAGVDYELGIRVACASDDDCDEGTRCSFIDRACVADVDPGCGSDEGEDNDSPGVASDLGAAAQANASGSMCEDDDDYFAFDLSEPTTIDVALTFSQPNDFDLYLFDDRGELVAVSNETDSVEEGLTLPSLAAGSWYLVVDQPATGLGLTGSFELTVEFDAGECVSDADCGSSEALPLCEDGACVPFVSDGPAGLGGPCAGDGDCDEPYQCYTGSPGFSDNFCTTTCRTDSSCEELDGGHCLELTRTAICYPGCDIDADCPRFYACDAGECQLFSCGVDDDCGEDRLCRRPEQTQFSVDVGLCTDIPFADCEDDDSREPNDTDSEATVIDDAVRGAMVCDEDEDWYRWTVADPGTTLTASVLFEGAADIDVYIYDGSGVLVGSGTEPDSVPEVAVAEYLPAGDYFIRINQFPLDSGDSSTSYNLDVETTAESCTVDGEECLTVSPLRIVCAEETGACEFFEGDGEVELGDTCDSFDDCTADAQFCWVFEPATRERNICTKGCRGDSDCDDVPNTVCVEFGGGFAACLPGE